MVEGVRGTVWLRGLVVMVCKVLGRDSGRVPEGLMW